MDKIEKPRNQLEVMFNKAVELEAENKRLRDELKGATRIIDEQDAENQRLREENAEKEACIQEDFHTLKGLENTLEEQGKTIERLRGLLAGMLYELSFCPICATDLIEDNTYISLPHADDCRLMKELSDG